MTTQPVSLSRDLAEKQVMRAELSDVDMAVWRSASGVVSAWENRCPHRGMRLSHGFVRGESLACAYHGWHYNCEGACHYIPAHPELEPPKTIKANLYNVTEASGIIWVNAVGTVSPVTLPSNTQAVRSVSVHCSLEIAAQAFKDYCSLSPITANTRTEVVSESPYVLALKAPLPANSPTPSMQDKSNPVSVFIALQRVNQTTTVAHITASEHASETDCIALSRWANKVRTHAEVSVGSTE